MNPGPVEEGGKVATGIVDALKSQPMVLALVLFNVIFIASIYFSLIDQRKHQSRLLELMLAQSDKAQALLSQCIVPRKEP